MPVFKCFGKIVKKNKVSFMIYIVIFVAVLIIFTKVGSSNTDTLFSDAAVPIAIIDQDGSALSEALTAYIGERHQLIDLENDSEALQDALFFREIEYILWIPDGFEKAFVSEGDNLKLENTKLPDSTSGIYIDQQIDRYLATLRAYLNSEFEFSDALSSTEKDLALSTTVELSTGEQAEVSTISFFFQYLPYVLIAVIISALGPVFMEFNKKELARRTEASSLSLKSKNMQMALGCIVVSLILWGLFMIAITVSNINDIFTLTSALRIFNSLIFLIISIGIAFLLGQFLKNSESLNFITNCIALGMSFVCGIFIPQELLGSGILFIAKFLPAYWYIRNNNILTGMTSITVANIQPYLQGILIQSAFAVAFFIVALVISRQKKFHPVV